jgi:hypothetical protein
LRFASIVDFNPRYLTVFAAEALGSDAEPFLSSSCALRNRVNFNGASSKSPSLFNVTCH